MLVTKCVGTKEYTQTNNPWIEGSHLKSDATKLPSFLQHFTAPCMEKKANKLSIKV